MSSTSSPSNRSWSPQLPKWSPEEQSLLPSKTTQPVDISLPTFLDRSESFRRAFPIDSNRCKTLKSIINEAILERNINSAYPVLHENILHLFARFIIHKRQNGTAVEKSVYKDMNLVQFIDRLLTKRAVTFMGKRDFYILLNGKRGSNGWESVGTQKEKSPLVLKDCLSYDEMKLSAFLSVGSYTYFMNIGDRKNFGVHETERTGIQDEGIIVGVIGPRLAKEMVMEYQELVITEAQNNKEKGYGNIEPPTVHHLFADLFEEECLEYGQIVENRKKLPKNNVQRYTDLKNREIFDNLLCYKRLLFSIDTLFMEANQRATDVNSTAYIHVVGIGLGVWKKSAHQNKIFMDACGQRIQILGKYLHNVSDICFAYINHDTCLKFKHGDTVPIEGHPLGGIKLHMYNREPHSRLTGADKDKLLVVSYAWDGNALPGNEYWNKKLGSSGDSAAASSTQIPELHNPFINPKVSAVNLKVVVADGVVGLQEYVKMIGKGEKRKHE